jgi:5-(carboxyamino)imidazole ribonucleotide mutase
MGPSVLHGPHQGAQKSTSTGVCIEAAITSVSKFCTVTSIMVRNVRAKSGYATGHCAIPVTSPLIGVVMGSSSDWDTMQHAVPSCSSSAWRTRRAWCRPTACRTTCSPTPKRPSRAACAPSSGAAAAPARHAGGQDRGAGAGRAGGQRHLQGVIRCTPSCRCPRACRWRPLPSARPARPTRRCSGGAAGGDDAALRERLHAFRAEQTAAARAMTLPPAEPR